MGEIGVDYGADDLSPRPSRHPFDGIDMRTSEGRRLRDLTLGLLRRHPDAGSPVVISQALVAARAQMKAEEITADPKSSAQAISTIMQVADLAARRVAGAAA